MKNPKPSFWKCVYVYRPKRSSVAKPAQSVQPFDTENECDKLTDRQTNCRSVCHACMQFIIIIINIIMDLLNLLRVAELLTESDAKVRN